MVRNQNVVISKKQTVGAKIFTTNTSERNLQVIEKPVADRVKFVQSEKLCFGCLIPGYHFKNCGNQMVCDTCSKRHPTCLHEDRSKQEQGPERTV